MLRNEELSAQASSWVCLPASWATDSPSHISLRKQEAGPLAVSHSEYQQGKISPEKFRSSRDRTADGQTKCLTPRPTWGHATIMAPV